MPLHTVNTPIPWKGNLMSNITVDALITAATRATASIKATKAANAEAVEQAFRESALATYAVVKASPKGGAGRLAEANKAAGAGYGSVAAVNYHSVVGQYLTLAEGEWDESGEVSAQRVQSTVKKVGQEVAKAIVKKARNRAAAFEALVAAVPAEVDILKVLKAALKSVSEAEQARLEGNALPEGADEIVEQIARALDNVSLGASPIPVEVIFTDADEDAPVLLSL